MSSSFPIDTATPETTGKGPIDPPSAARAPLARVVPMAKEVRPSADYETVPREAGRPPLRVWLLTNVPSPYQVELFTAIAAVREMNLTIRYMRQASETSAGVKETPRTILRGIGPGSWRDEIRLHPGAVRECLFGRYDCYVLSGLMNSVTFLACTLALRLRGARWGVWLERPRPRDAAWRSGWLTRGPLRWLRNLHLRKVLASARRVIGIGRAAVEAYSAEGVPSERLGVLPYCCDVARFAPASPEARDEIRGRKGLTGRVVFLFSGRLVERKGGDTLLLAFQRIAADHPATTLVILGDGPARETLRALVPAELAGRVTFRGHVPQADLPDEFQAADIFVFPSRHDGWGVVVNEACAAGLPIIASRQTGAARDLVVDNVNGFQVDCDDVEELAARMAQLAGDSDLRREFGAKSLELVERFTVANGALIFLDEMRTLAGVRKSSPDPRSGERATS